MTKIPKNQITQVIIDEDIWHEDNEAEWYIFNRNPNWDDVVGENMSWQWYMERDIRVREGWAYVVIHPNHKVETAMNWLKEHYPDCAVKTEWQHMLISDSEAATMVALQWA